MENENNCEKLTVLIVEPEKLPRKVEMEVSYEALRELVGGDIEMVGLDRDTFLYCNAEGKLLGLPGNRKLDNGDIVAGTFILLRDDGTGIEASLTDKQIEKYMARFIKTEQYTKNEVKDISFMSIQTYRKSEDFEEAEDDLER